MDVHRDPPASVMTIAAPKNRITISYDRCASDRFSSLIPGLGVKLSNDRPCRAHCSLRGRGDPPHAYGDADAGCAGQRFCCGNHFFGSRTVGSMPQ